MAEIEIRNLSKIFESHKDSNLKFLALEELNFTVEDKKFVCLLGPSGCGKSTILNIIAGLEEPTSGEVLIGGKACCYGDDRTCKIGYVFQEPRLLPWLTVEKNIHFVLESQGIPSSQWKEISSNYIEMVRLREFEKSYPYQLSGGMQQRTSIARAFSINPDILLMDEPFSGLDEITARKLRYELLNIWRNNQKTILFVTHNSFEATFLADKILIMNKCPGKIYKEIKVNIPRPRDYDNPMLFEFNRAIVKDFIKFISPDEDLQIED